MSTRAEKRTDVMLGGSILLVLTCLGICSAATQYVAQRLSYHPALGQPWATLPWIGRFYPPFAWFDWQARFYPTAKPTFNAVYVGFLVAIGAVFLLYALIIGSTRRSKGHPGVHGTAHWADEREVRNSGLLPSPGQSGAGVYVGGWLDTGGRLRYLRHDGPEHVAAIAPTRSGKGVGLVVPTLLSWPHSVVVNDMKGELWTLTAGWRQRDADNAVLKFDPASQSGSCAFNPLAEVRLATPHEVGDVQNLVTIIVDPDGKGLADHWAKTAHAFLTGVILHLLYKSRKQRPAGLSNVAMALSDPERPIDDLYAEMLENRHMGTEAHPVVAAAARDMLNRPEQERGSVLSTAMSYLSLYRDPLVAHNTAHSDFRIMDLMNHERPVSLYLVVRPADKDRLKPLMRLVINQIVRVLTRDDVSVGEVDRHRLLLMLDEFPSYGRLEIFQEAHRLSPAPSPTSPATASRPTSSCRTRPSWQPPTGGRKASSPTVTSASPTRPTRWKPPSGSPK